MDWIPADAFGITDRRNRIERFADHIYRRNEAGTDDIERRGETFEAGLTRLGLTEEAIIDASYHIALDDMVEIEARPIGVGFEVDNIVSKHLVVVHACVLGQRIDVDAVPGYA